MNVVLFRTFFVLVSFTVLVCSHRSSKKQFINYGTADDGGNNYGGYDRGGSENFLGSNLMGGGESSDSYGMTGSSKDSLVSFEDAADGRPSDYSSFTNPTDVGLAEPSPYTQGSPLLNGLDNSGTGNNELLQSFSDDPFEKKLEDSVNLGDSMETPEYSSLSNSNKGIMDKLMNSDYSEFPDNSQQKEVSNIKHDNGDGREGIGNKFNDVQDLLQGELGQLDSADDKLQKMLESDFDSDSNSFANTDAGLSPNAEVAGNQGGNQVAANNGLMDGFQNEMNQLDTQLSDNANPSSQQMNNYQEAAGGYQSNGHSGEQEMSGQNPLAGIQHITVHAHASDKSSSHAHPEANPIVSQDIAAKVQEDNKKNHDKKLTKLKTRLKLLRQKLSQLEDEQAKKSSYMHEETPRASRNNAIKRLLIKNLKLAAMIASKEIQLEEAKGRGLAYLSRKKDDNLKLDKDEEVKEIEVETEKSHEFINNTGPLTELSKKAEEEVNHLTKNMLQTEKASSKSNLTKTEVNKESNNTLNKHSILSNNTNSITSDNDKDHSLGFLGKINETLQILDKSGTADVNAKNESDPSPVLQNTEKRFLTTLNSKIRSMSEFKAIEVQEKALSSLYDAIKIKASENAKKRNNMLRNYPLHQTSKNVSSTS